MRIIPGGDGVIQRICKFLCEHLFILFSSSFLSLCDRLACVGSARIAHGCFLLCVDTSYEPISLSQLQYRDEVIDVPVVLAVRVPQSRVVEPTA